MRKSRGAILAFDLTTRMKVATISRKDRITNNTDKYM